MKKIVYLATLTVSLMYAGSLFAGGVYSVETKNHMTSPPQAQNIEVTVEGRNLKMGIVSGAQPSRDVMIYHGDRREMVAIDHDKKSYFVIDKKMMDSMAGQMNQMKSQMDDLLAKVPESQRGAMAEMMKKGMPPQKPQGPKLPPAEVRNTGDRDTINGYPCVKYEVLRDGKKIHELWVTDWKNVEGGVEVADAFKDMAAFFTEMMESIGSMTGTPEGMGNPLGNDSFPYMKDLNGLPVVARDFKTDGSLKGESILRSAKRQTIAPAAFEPPAGYKNQAMPIPGGR